MVNNGWQVHRLRKLFPMIIRRPLGGRFLVIRGDLGEGKVSIEDVMRGEKERCYSLSERRSHPAGEDIESAYSPYCFQHIS